MLIKALSQDKALALLQEWNGSTAGSRPTDSERMFRAMCDRYVLIEVESIQELSKLDDMERYLTGGHGFYIYLRYPTDVVSAIRRGMVAMPGFFRRAEEGYSSAVKRGNMKILVGLLQEKVDQYMDTGLFIDIMDRQKQEKAEAARRLYAQSYAPIYTQPPQQTYQPEPQPEPQPAYQPEPARQNDQRATVVHYHFGDQVS